MLVLCYGLTKSGSTLAFELIKAMLTSAGHVQERLPDGPVNPGHRVNYVQPLNRQRLNEILSAVGDRWIAVKTHAGISDPFFMYLEKLQRKRRIQVVVSYRDPRDICLSMLDAGNAARAAGVKEFSEITDLAVAANLVADQIEQKFYKWAAISGALLLEYDVVAFDPEAAISRIENCLGLKIDREEVKRYAFEEAFTQKNKGRRNRFETELTPQEAEGLRAVFAPFISNFMDGVSEKWLFERRLQIIGRESLRAASGRQRR